MIKYIKRYRYEYRYRCIKDYSDTLWRTNYNETKVKPRRNQFQYYRQDSLVWARLVAIEIDIYKIYLKGKIDMNNRNDEGIKEEKPGQLRNSGDIHCIGKIRRVSVWGEGWMNQGSILSMLSLRCLGDIQMLALSMQINHKFGAQKRCLGWRYKFISVFKVRWKYEDWWHVRETGWEM